MANVYTEEEQDILNLTKKIRVDALKELSKEGPITDTRVLRIVNELSSSLETHVNNTANTRIKSQDSENNKANAEMIVAAIMSKRDNNVQVTPDQRVLKDEDVIEIEVVEGQTDINPGQLNPSDFIDEYEDE